MSCDGWKENDKNTSNKGGGRGLMGMVVLNARNFCVLSCSSDYPGKNRHRLEGVHSNSGPRVRPRGVCLCVCMSMYPRRGVVSRFEMRIG